NANPIKYALIVNPAIYISCIQQFWDYAKVKTVNEDAHIRALVDGKKIIVTEASIRCDLKLQDDEEEVGEGSKVPTKTHHTPIVTQPSSSQPQKKQESKRKQKDPPPSGEDRMKLTELMNLCTNLQKRVLDLERAKTAQAKEIIDLKKRVKKPERKKKSRTSGLKRLYKVGFSARIVSSDEEEQNAAVPEKEVNTVDPVTNAGEVVTIAKDVEVTTAAATPQISKDDVTLAQTLIEIKAAKPRVIGVIVQEPSEFKTTSPSQLLQLPHAKDKGKGIMVEPEKPLEKKDQIALDEEVARNLEAQMKAEMEKKERIAREKDEANIDVIEERSKLLAELIESRRKVNTFVDINTEIVEERLKKTQAEVTGGSFKRARDEIEQESAKRRRLKKEDDTAKLKRCLEMVPEDDDVAIKATPLSSKSPTILKAGDKTGKVCFLHCYKKSVDRVFVDHLLFLEKLVSLSLSNVITFEVLCQSLNIEPTVTLFQVFQTLSKQGDWFSFAKRGDPTPVCMEGVNSGLKLWKEKVFLIYRREIPFHMPWRHLDSCITDRVPTSFNQNHVDRIKAHIVKLYDIPEGVLVRSGTLPFLIKLLITSPALVGTAIPNASLEEIVVTQPDCKVVIKANNAAKRKASIGPEISTNATKKTRSSKNGSRASSSGHSAEDGVKQANDDKEVEPDVERSKGVRRTTRAGFRASHGISEDASPRAQEGTSALNAQPLDADVDVNKIGSNGNVDPYYEARVGNTVGDVLEIDLLLIVSRPYYIPYLYDKGSGSESPPYIKYDWEEIHGVNLEKENIKEELVETKSQLEHRERQAEEIQGCIASFFQSDVTPLIRRFIKSGDFNRAFAGVLNTEISVGFERRLRMCRPDEEFRELSQRVDGFILDAKEKFDRVVAAFPATTFPFLKRHLKILRALCKTSLDLSLTGQVLRIIYDMPVSGDVASGLGLLDQYGLVLSEQLLGCGQRART
nr:hypothetical protein [Tanacetum cinerariifolium]